MIQEDFMELKEARYILSIYKNKTISKAAEDLYISQPSLSKYLKNIEAQLGEPLFDRINNVYVPTYVGERYLYYARKIVNYGKEWLNEFDDLTHQGKGRINVAIPVMLGNSIIEPTLPKFYQQYPHVEINLMEEVNFVSEHFLEDNSVDFVLYNVAQLPNNLDYEILHQEEMVMIVSKENPLSRLGIHKDGFSNPWVDIRKFKNESFILMYPDHTTGRLTNDLFKAHAFKPNVLLRTRNSQLSIRLALQNVGIAFAPRSYYETVRHEDTSVAFSIGTAPIMTTMIAGYLKNRYMPKYTKDFLQMIAHYATHRDKH